MSSLTSQAALHGLDRAGEVLATAKLQRSRVGHQLGKLMPVVPAKIWERVQQVLAEHLATATNELRRADHALRTAEVRLADLRRARRAVAERLRTELRLLRSSFTGTYGEEALELVGLDVPPVRGFLALREQGREVVERLRNEDLMRQLPLPRAGLAGIAVVPIAAAFGVVVEELAGLVGTVGEWRGRVVAARVAQQSALRRQRRVDVQVRGILGGYRGLVGGEDVLATNPPLRGTPRPPSTADSSSPPLMSPPTPTASRRAPRPAPSDPHRPRRAVGPSGDRRSTLPHATPSAVRPALGAFVLPLRASRHSSLSGDQWP